MGLWRVTGLTSDVGNSQGRKCDPDDFSTTDLDNSASCPQPFGKPAGTEAESLYNPQQEPAAFPHPPQPGRSTNNLNQNGAPEHDPKSGCTTSTITTLGDGSIYDGFSDLTKWIRFAELEVDPIARTLTTVKIHPM